MYFNATNFGLYVLVSNLAFVLAFALVSTLTKTSNIKGSIVGLFTLGFFPPLNIVYFLFLLTKIELKKKSCLTAEKG